MNKQGSALIVVDMQNDFIPGVSVSALPVTGGDLLVKPINACMEDFDVVVGTQDWHPKGHDSFASTHGMAPFSTRPRILPWRSTEDVMWPDHCVQGSWGAQLEPFLKTDKMNLILRKGMNPMVDSYSAFNENWGPNALRAGTGLAEWLRFKGVYRVFICGLAKDYCVKWTAQDSVAAGFVTYLFEGLSKSVDPKGDEKLTQELKQQGVQIIW